MTALRGPAIAPQTVLITGATAGIGLALARLYQRRGAQLILIGRRPLAELDPTLFNQEHYCQADLADTTSAENVCDWLDRREIAALHLVIHNAGVGYVGSLADQPAANIRQLVAVNLMAPVVLSHRLMGRVAAVQGTFVFIGSAVAPLPSPAYAVYAATKAALSGFVRNLQIELRATSGGASAQIIHPGATRSGMHAKSGASHADIPWQGFPPAEQRAIEIADAIANGRRSVTIGLTNQLARRAAQSAPALFDHRTRARYARNSVAEPAPSPVSDPAGRPPHCVITGAADGIGRALALEFGAAGYTVTGIDRDAERAMRTQAELINRGGSARFILGDLALPESLERILTTLETQPTIDLLIHSAGINDVGAFSASDLSRQRTVGAVNLTAPMVVTASLLQRGRIAPGASMVFISSLSHYLSYPGAAVYAATKDGISSFARSLSVALAPIGLHVLTVYPGPTRTEHARRHSPDNRREQRRMAPERVAREVRAALGRRQRVLIPGVGNRLSATVGRLAPALTESIMRRMILDRLD